MRGFVKLNRQNRSLDAVAEDFEIARIIDLGELAKHFRFFWREFNNKHKQKDVLA